MDLAISYCTPGARRYKNGQRFACSVRATEQFAVKKSRRKNICIISISVFFRFASFIVSDTEGGRLPCFSALHCFGLSLCFGLCLCPFLRSSCCLLFAFSRFLLLSCLFLLFLSRFCPSFSLLLHSFPPFRLLFFFSGFSYFLFFSSFSFFPSFSTFPVFFCSRFFLSIIFFVFCPCHPFPPLPPSPFPFF